MGSKCEFCGKEFKFNSVPYMHKKVCAGFSDKVEEAILIDPYVKRGEKLADKVAIGRCKEVIKGNLGRYFSVDNMSGNERAMLNRMLDESDGIIVGALNTLLRKHGIKVMEEVVDGD